MEGGGDSRPGTKENLAQEIGMCFAKTLFGEMMFPTEIYLVLHPTSESLESTEG